MVWCLHNTISVFNFYMFFLINLIKLLSERCRACGSMWSWNSLKCGPTLSPLIVSQRVGGGGSLLQHFEAKAPLAFIVSLFTRSFPELLWLLRVLWVFTLMKWQLFVDSVSINIKKDPLFSPWSELSDSWLKLFYVLVWPGWIMGMKDEKNVR